MKKMFKARATNLPKYMISQFKEVERTVFLTVIGAKTGAGAESNSSSPATMDAPVTS
jgi:hypothetical protein